MQSIKKKYVYVVKNRHRIALQFRFHQNDTSTDSQDCCTVYCTLFSYWLLQWIRDAIIAVVWIRVQSDPVV
jgi:hypothetical protein